MRFSLFSLLDVYDNEARTSAAIYQQTLEQIVLADELGFDYYWIGEHHGYLKPDQVLSCPNPAILLAAAANVPDASARIRLLPTSPCAIRSRSPRIMPWSICSVRDAWVWV